MTARERNREMARIYAEWRAAEKHLHPYDPARRGYAALAQVFGVSVHAARHAVAYARP